MYTIFLCICKKVREQAYGQNSLCMYPVTYQVWFIFTVSHRTHVLPIKHLKGGFLDKLETDISVKSLFACLQSSSTF